MTNPPLADTVATLMNASTNNARILQTLVHDRMPDTHGRLDVVANNTYADFLKTKIPIFLKAEEPLEAVDWIQTIEKKFGLIHCSDV